MGISFYSIEQCHLNPCRALILTDYTHTPPKLEQNPELEMSSLIDRLYLMKLDPLKWKEQDHYRLLGLSSLREKATSVDIKKAYHKMVLQYHPDKQHQSDHESYSNIFKCIQKAYDILSDPHQRHYFDSVDPSFDESIPDVISKNKLEADPLLFYKTFIPAFEKNSRFSKIKPTPSLGHPSSSRVEVENFYNFWYNFESTRTFEYLDEEETSHADNRYDKRYLDKKNKAARLKRKTEDNARLRKLVDNAVQCDPRLKAFKEIERREKEEKRKAKSCAFQKSNANGIIMQKKEAEEEQKKKLLLIKKDKEEERSFLKQLRKDIRLQLKEHSFFTKASQTGLLEKRITAVDSKLASITNIEELREFSSAVGSGIKHCIKDGNVDSFYQNFFNGTTSIPEAPLKEAPLNTEVASSAKLEPPIPVDWSTTEIQSLIKACNSIPGGTRGRWEKIASYVREHAGVSHTRTNEEIIDKSREIMKHGKLALDDLNENELQNSLKKKSDHRIDNIVPHADQHTPDNNTGHKEAWTRAEQQALEDGLRKYASNNPNRWSLISQCIPTRTKQEIIERYKEIAKALKAATK